MACNQFSAGEVLKNALTLLYLNLKRIPLHLVCLTDTLTQKWPNSWLKIVKNYSKEKEYREGNIELGLQESFMTLNESLLTRELVAELIRLRQQYSKEPITKSNAPAIVQQLWRFLKTMSHMWPIWETRDLFFRQIIKGFRSLLTINLTISQRNKALRERSVK